MLNSGNRNNNETEKVDQNTVIEVKSVGLTAGARMGNGEGRARASADKPGLLGRRRKVDQLVEVRNVKYRNRFGNECISL